MKKNTCSWMLFLLALAAPGLAQTNETAPTVLTLVQARDMALRNHPQIAAANYRAMAAREVVKESRSGFFPQATLFGSAVGADSQTTRIMAGGLNNPSVYDRAAEGLGLSALITDFGRTANLVASSKSRARAEDQNAAATREEVLLQVDVDYLSALQARAVEQVARETLDTRQLLLDQVSLLASNKLKSELDVSFAKVALEEGRLLWQKAENDYAASQASLSTALGFRELHEFTLVEGSLPFGNETNDISTLITESLEHRPDLVSLRDEKEAEFRLARSQRDARLPILSAVGAVGNSLLHDDRLPDNYAAGGIQLSLPIFAGGLYTARQHEAEMLAEAAGQLLRSAENNAIRDVRIAWLNLSNARERLQTTQELLAHATEAYDLAQARYKVGSSSIVELSQAQLEFTSAQIANTNARYDVLVQQSNLSFEVGDLSNSDAGLDSSTK